MAAIVRVSRPAFLIARDLTSERRPREETGRKPKLRVLSDFRKRGRTLTQLLQISNMPYI